MKSIKKLSFLIVLLTFLKLSAQSPGSGHCLKFTGNNHVSLGNAFTNISLPVSVSLWFKPDAVSNTHRIFYSHTSPTAYTGFWFQVIGGNLAVAFGDGTARAHFARRSATAPVNLQANRWYHLGAVIHSATSMDLYLNGIKLQESYTGSGNTTMYVDNSAGFLGRNSGGSNIEYLNGEIDELRVWNSARTQADIRNHMCERLTGVAPPALLGNYHFDNTTGNVVLNSAGTGNGSLQNSPQRILSSAPVGDRSLEAYANTAFDMISLQNDTIKVWARPSANNSVHFYMVDQLTPGVQRQNLNVVPTVNHYAGVFTSDNASTFDIEHRPNQSLRNLFANDLQLAQRDHNADSSWTINPPRNTPNIRLNNQSGPQQQYSLHLNPCLISIPSLGADKVICNDTTYTLSINPPQGTSINWSNGDTSQSTTINQSGKYWILITDTNGCKGSDTINITFAGSASALDLLPSDTLLCNKRSLLLSVQVPGALSYSWSNGLNTSQISVSRDGSYVVTAYLPGGCTVKDSINVIFSIIGDPLEKDSYSLCNGGSVELKIDPAQFQSAEWSNAMQGLNATYTTLGKHWVSAANSDGCVVTDSFTIVPATPLSGKQIFNDTSFCFSEQIRLSAPDGLQVKWPDGSDSVYTVYNAQQVRVDISDGCTNSTEFFEVEAFDCDCKIYFASAFSPNGDGLNEYYRAEAECDFTKYSLKIYDRFGKRVFKSLKQENAFDGTHRGEQLAIGVYTYIFEYSTPQTSGKKVGYFTLLR